MDHGRFDSVNDGPNPLCPMKIVAVVFASLLLGLSGLPLCAAPADVTALADALAQPTPAEVISTPKRKTYSATIEIQRVNARDGSFVGQLTWPSLRSIHRIEGKITKDALTFKETAYIKKGSAHLNCSYQLKKSGGKLVGTWQEPGVDQGTITITLAATSKPEVKPEPAKSEKPVEKPAAGQTAAPAAHSAESMDEPTAAAAQTTPAKPEKPAEENQAAAVPAPGKVAELPDRPSETVPADAKGFYKLVETEFFLTKVTDGSCNYGPQSGQSSFSTTHSVKPLPGGSGRTQWSTLTRWSVPEIMVPGQSYKFQLAGSSSGDEYSALLGLSMGFSNDWPLAAVRRGLKARMGGESVSDVGSAEFSFTLPKEIADWRDKTMWNQAATVRAPDSEMGMVYQQSGSARVTTKTSADIPLRETKLTVKDWMYGEGDLQKITVYVAIGADLNHDSVARYTYKWQDKDSKEAGLEIVTTPADLRGLRIDGQDSIIIKARVKPAPKEKAEITRNKTRGIRFSAVGANATWARLDNTMMSGDWQCVTVRAIDPNGGAGKTSPSPATLQIRVNSDHGTQTLDLKLVSEQTALTLTPDKFECVFGSRQTAQVQVAVTGGGKDAWKIRADYEKDARPFATCTVKQTDGQHAVLDLKEAGLKPERGDDHIDTSTLLVTAEKKGRPTLQAKLNVRLLQEGLFLLDLTGHALTGRFTVFADGKKQATEIDYRLFAFDPKSKQVANLAKDGAVRKKIIVECLENKSSEAARLLASGQLQTDATRLRQLNEPAGTLRLTFAKELPGDGRTVPCRFRLRYPDRKEDAFSGPFTIGIATTENGPDGKNWNEELERCETIIRKFVPLTYRARMQAMLDNRKRTLGAEGLAHLRKRIWNAAAQLTLAEGGKGYENEAAWANTITETLEWTKWAGDFAFDVSVGIYMGPYGSTSAGILKEVIQSAIEAYQEGKSAREWAWEYICTIPELVEGKVIDVDAFEKWGVESKAKAWAIYVGYHFLKNLTAGEGIVAALRETAKTVGENVLTGWLSDQIEANKDHRVAGIVRGKN